MGNSLNKVIYVVMILAFMVISSTSVFAETSDKTEGGILTDDSAYISSAVIIQKQTGTPVWDDKEGQGNDTSPDDDIVRSFDTVSYTLETNIRVNDTDNGSEDAKKYYNFKGGKIYFEARFPDELSEYMHWSTEKMGWASNLKADKGLLSGYYQMPEGEVTIPGKQSLVFSLKVDGCPNGKYIQPEFTTWIQGNSEDEKVEVVDKEGVHITAKPAYNVQLIRNTNLTKEIEWEEDGTNYIGRCYGYGFVVQLYNEDKNKGLKGLEYAKGDVTFDIETELIRKSKSTGVEEDITDVATPILYNYKVNNYTHSGEKIPNRPMDFSWHSDDAIYLAGSDRSDGRWNTQKYLDRYVYDGGDIDIVQNGNKLNVTFSDYAFDGIFPIKGVGITDSAPATYGENEGCFVTGYIQVVVPKNEETTKGDCNYWLTVKDTNMKVTSVSDQEVSEQVVTSDDLNRVQHIVNNPGTYNTYNWLNHFSNDDNYVGGGLYTQYGKGDAKAAQTQEFIYRHDFKIGGNSDLAYETYDANCLMKFDASIVEPYPHDGEYYKVLHIVGTNCTYVSDMDFDMLFAAKPDGENWVSDDELLSTEEEDLLYFESLEEMKEKLGEDAVCIGYLLESKSGYAQADAGYVLCANLRVREDAPIGDIGMFTAIDKIWVKGQDLDRSTMTYRGKTSTDVENPILPTPYKKFKYNYEKSIYDEDGNITGGHYYGYSWGQSLRVVNAQSSIINKVKGNKVNFDLSKNENEVPITLDCSIKSSAEINRSVTGYIDYTLPKGLKYIDNSCNLGTPEVIENSDGSFNLRWEIEDFIINGDSVKVDFKAELDQSLKNGTQLELTAVISAPEVDYSAIVYRTSKTSITVSNLSSHRLFKKAVVPVVDVGEDIEFSVSYVNNNDFEVSDWKLLDILPYIGDERGTDYTGSYVLKEIKVSQVDLDTGSEASNDIHFYVTNDNSIRGETVKTVNTSSMEEITDLSNINRECVALAADGVVGARTQINIDMIFSPVGNTSGDVYYNNVSCDTSANTEPIVTPAVRVGVVYREISGCLWEENIVDGIREISEELLSNKKVMIVNSDGSEAKDVFGNKVEYALTDENGVYRFKNMESGDYKVYVVPDDVSPCDGVTWYQIEGSSEDNDCDAVEELGNFVINSIYLKTLDELRSEDQYKDIKSNRDIGVYTKPEITIEKALYLDSVVFAKGNPTFIIKVKGEDGSGKELEWIKSFEFTEDDTVGVKGVTFKVPVGNYTVSEVDVNGYILADIEVTNGIRDGDKAVVDLINNDKASCKFINRVSDYRYLTHNDIIINQLR